MQNGKRDLRIAIMGAGPGVLLVNTPEPWLGLPSLCTWGLFWYSIQALTAVSAYLFVWRDLYQGLRASVWVPAQA